MATSGTTTLTITAEDILKRAFFMAGLMTTDNPKLTAEFRQVGIDAFNFLIKDLNSYNFHLWKKELVRVTTVTNRTVYKFGTDADKFETIKFETHAIAAATSADTTIDVAGAATDAPDTSTIDVYVDDGTVHTTTVSGTPASITGGIRITLTDAIDDDLQNGGAVVVWQDETSRVPDRILDAWYSIQNSTRSDEVDVDLYVVDPTEVDQWTAKTVDMDTPYVTYERTYNTGKLRLSNPMATSGAIIKLTAEFPVEVISAITDEVDMPAEWIRPLAYMLAKDLMDMFPNKQYSDAHRLNIIREASNARIRATEFVKAPKDIELIINDSDYEE